MYNKNKLGTPQYIINYTDTYHYRFSNIINITHIKRIIKYNNYCIVLIKNNYNV